MPDKQASVLNLVISYAPDDLALLNEFKGHLSTLINEGILSCWDDQQIVGGKDKEQEIREHLDAASLILLLLSPDYFASTPCYAQMEQALKRKRDIPIIPILLRPCNWTYGPLKGLQVLPRNEKAITSWDNQDEAFQEVVQDIHQIIDNLWPQGVGASSSLIDNLPYERNLLFTGREEILDQLSTALSNQKSATLTQAISGLGGIGKTQTALEYAYRHQHDYSPILWLNADSRTSMLTDINAIAQLLNLPERHQPDQTILLNAFKSWLQHHQGWLLILDNADDLNLVKDFLPRKTRGHTLITTRSQITGNLAQRIEIEEMGLEEGALFLLRRTRILEPEDSFAQASEHDQRQAKKIAELMDGLPLALDQAGAYIDETQCGLDGYIELFQKRHKELLKRRGRNVLDHPDPVATTWSLSFEKVQQANPMSVEILSLCAFLDPDSIMEEIFTEGASQLGPILSIIDEDPLAFNDAITELLNYSLIRRNPDHTLTIHRLVQLMLRNGVDQDTQRLWAKRAVLVISGLFPLTEYENWPLCLALLPQAKNGVALIEQWSIESTKAARLLNQIGTFLNEQGEYKEARELIERALQLKRKVLGEEHPSTITSVNNLASLYVRQGRYGEAKPLYEQGLRLRRKVLGEEHPDTLTSMNNLASLYVRQGRYREAEALHEQALRLSRKVLGEEHPSTLTSINNLAWLYESQGRYEEVEALYEQGLRLSRKVLGEEHPSTLTSVNNLAFLYARQGRYGEAKPLYEQALQLRRKVLGEEHPDTLTSINNLAGLYESQGRYEEAEALYEQGLQLRRKVLREEHPDTIASANNLAGLYARQGRYGEAEPLYEQALKISVKVLGEEHPTTLTIARSYVYLLKLKEEKHES